jgi:hypothetical protein
MFGSILLRIGTYLVETFIGKGAVKDGGIRLENVKNAIESKINDVKKTTEIGSIKNMLVEIVEADDKTIRSEKVDAVINQIDKVNFAQPTEVGTETVNGFSNNLIRFISETGVLKIGFGILFITLLVFPGCIKSSIKESELGRVFRSSLSTVSEKLSVLEINGVKITFAKNEFGALKIELERIKSEVGKIGNKDLEDQIQELINRLENSKKELQTNNDPKNINNPKEGWVYLGKTDQSRQTLLPDGITIGQTDIQKLKVNTQISFTDNVYLRTETKDCPRSKGEILNVISIGDTVTLSEDASKSLCEIGDTKTFAVWAKVRKN